jgi:signal-transduction protein with cAMP-binding, CBS, and nucleotidyltransferase domain
MLTGRICTRVVATAVPTESVRVAAQRMAHHGVGTLVIVDPVSLQPLGVVTDRDLAIRCLAENRDPDAETISAVMTAPALTIADDVPIEEATTRMAKAGIRRLVVTGTDAGMVGLLSLDDVLERLVEEVNAVGRLLERQSPRIAA